MVPPGKSRFRRGTPAGTGFGNIGGQCAPRKPMQPAAFSPPVPQHQEDCWFNHPWRIILMDRKYFTAMLICEGATHELETT